MVYKSDYSLFLILKTSLSILLFLSTACFAADQPQWGARHSRNMISGETNLATAFDLDAGTGIVWSVDLGGAYGSPVVAQGRVFIGANNSEPLDERHRGDRGSCCA